MQPRGSATIFCCQGVSLNWSFFFLLPFVAVMALFLILLLFWVNCSHANPWSLPFVLPIVLSRTLQGGGKGEIRGVRQQCMVWKVLMGALLWRVPFLNHNRQKEASYLIAEWIAFFLSPFLLSFFFLSDLHFDLSSEFLRIDPYYYEEQCFHRF